MVTAGIIVAVIVVAVLIGCVVLYNNLVTLRNRVDNAWDQVEVQLQRRFDLIPNLVETVKGYAAHENATLDEVTRARSAVASAQGPEDKISYMRQSYNDTVMKYNTAIQTFPALLVAGPFGFRERTGFDAVASANEAPKVSFDRS